MKKPWTKWLILISLLLSFLLAACSADTTEDTVVPAAPAESGEPAQPSVPAGDEDKATLARGKPQLVEFYADW